MNSRQSRAASAILMFGFAFAAALPFMLAFPRPVRAQAADVIGGPTTVSASVFDQITTGLTEGVMVAAVSATNQFAQQVASMLAQNLLNCAGQKPCFDSKEFSKGLKDAVAGAAGEAIGAFSEASGLTAMGLNLCAPNINLTLNLQLGLLDEIQPPRPKCDLSKIAESWGKVGNQFSKGEMMKMLKDTVKPGKSPLSAGLRMGSFIQVDVQPKAYLEQSLKVANKYAGGGGFSDITDPVTGNVLSPAAVAKKEFDLYKDKSGVIPDTGVQMAASGALAAKAWKPIVGGMVQTFAMTLIKGFWNKGVQELLSLMAAEEAATEVALLDRESLVNPGLVQSSERIGEIEAPSSLIRATPIKGTGMYDVVTLFGLCPEAYRGPENCVMDQALAVAIRSGNAIPLTVGEALKQDLLHKDFRLIPATSQDNAKASCYQDGYCETNLKKMRAARIIPIGWEIAASKVAATGEKVTLGQVVAGFNVCGVNGAPDAANPATKWCHLIDPNWVLKAPSAECRAKVYGPVLLSAGIATRAETCTDVATCLKEDDFGQCVGGYGYCTQDRRVWRFNADSCPEYYNSCRTFKSTSGKTENFLVNTLDYGVCNSSNEGCRAYSTRLNAGSCTLGAVCSNSAGCSCTIPRSCKVGQGEKTCLLLPSGEQCRLPNVCQTAECDCSKNSSCLVVSGARSCSTIVGGPEAGDDWQITPALYLNKQAQGCSADKNGCTALVKLAAGQSLNLVKNGSFETLEDMDADGASDHAKYWSPFGKVTVGGAGGIITERGADNKFYASAGSNAARVGGDYEDVCTLNTACANYPSCTCPKGGYSCAVAKGETSCSLTNRLIQDRLPLEIGKTYTLSADLRQIPAALVPGPGAASATLRLKFYQSDYNQSASMAGWVKNDDVIVTPNVGPCDFTPAGGLFMTLTAATDPALSDAAYVRPSCTFTVSRPIAGAYLEISGAQTMVDGVLLNEGGGVSYHDTYGEVESLVYAKVAPNYLGCTGEDGDRAECKSFAMVCRDNEVGCDRYTPATADPAIPGVVGPQDACPAECSGYDVFKQEASEFERASKFPIYFIPKLAQSCSEAEIGCSEFTDLENEQRSYYSRLRICQKPEADTNQVFYSWEGSDTAGYQLKVWNLKRTEAQIVTAAATASDVCAPTAGGTCGYSPCVHLNTAAPVGDDRFECLDESVAIAGAELPDGFCTRDSIDAGHDYDCREFYDEFGNRHYRLMSRVIVAAADCRRYRITGSIESDCRDSNGSWNEAKQECIYAASAGDSLACAAASKGCRAYKGNAASNIRAAFTDAFEQAIDAAVWKAGTAIPAQSSEALVVGGHSLKLSGTATDRREIVRELGTLVTGGQSYSLSFWARGGGILNISFGSETGAGTQVFSDDNNATKSAPKIILTSEWRRYALGPVIFQETVVAGPDCPNGRCLKFSIAGSAAAPVVTIGEVYLDNLILNEVRDTISVVRDSWKIPASCDQTLAGAASPREMLGCREYRNTAGKVSYLRSFSKLCRDKVVGCSAYSDTKNTVENPYEESFNAVCSLPARCGSPEAPADGGTNCICNYRLPHAAASAEAPLMLFDACRVAFNETECRITKFNLETRASLASRAANPDIVVVPADSLTHLVVTPQDKCEAANIGCRTVGVPNQAFDGVCVNRVANKETPVSAETGCEDPKTKGYCKIKIGESRCQYSVSEPIIGSWKAAAVKDNPADYSKTLCLEKEVGCAQYSTRDGSYYFKDPGNRACEYRENVFVKDRRVSGWFRKTESGALLPCYGDRLVNGEFYAIAKNKDQRCDLKTPCTQDAGCPCYLSTSPDSPDCTLASACTKPEGCACPNEGQNSCTVGNTKTTCKVEQACRVMRGNSVCGFDGWVGLCAAEYDRCEEFVDTVATSPNHAAGEPYYYIFNSKIDQSTCGGNVDLKTGCVALKQTSNPQNLYSAAASYVKAGDMSASPVNCNLSNRSDELCGSRCFSYVNGTCEDITVLGQACNQDADCGVGRCIGTESYGFGCRSDRDCSSQLGEKCMTYGDPATCPSGKTCRRSLTGVDFTRNDANIVLKVRPDRECARWLNCRESEITWDETKGEWRESCTGFGLCEESTVVGVASECRSYVEPEKSRLTNQQYAQRDVSWKGLEFSGYSVPNAYPAQYLLPATMPTVTGNKSGSCMGDINKYGVACATDADCGSKAWCSKTEMTQQRYGVNLALCKSGAKKGELCTNDKDCGGVSGSCALTCRPNDDSGSGISSDCVDQKIDPDFGASNKGGRCYQHLCYYDYTGGPLLRNDVGAMPLCRAYPEVDSPYSSTIILKGQAGYDAATGTASGVEAERSPDFAGANICHGNGNDCECAYQKLTYGTNYGEKRYLGVKDATYERGFAKTLCVGGSEDGKPCDLGSGAIDPGLKAACVDGQGQCQKLKSVSTLLGWPGFCLDYDESLIINNDEARRACIMWLPVDKLSGMPDRFNQFREAGYQQTSALSYCAVAEGTQVAGQGYSASRQYTGSASGNYKHLFYLTNGEGGRLIRDWAPQISRDQIAGIQVDFNPGCNPTASTCSNYGTRSQTCSGNAGCTRWVCADGTKFRQPTDCTRDCGSDPDQGTLTNDGKCPNASLCGGTACNESLCSQGAPSSSGLVTLYMTGPDFNGKAIDWEDDDTGGKRHPKAGIWEGTETRAPGHQPANDWPPQSDEGIPASGGQARSICVNLLTEGTNDEVADWCDRWSADNNGQNDRDCVGIMPIWTADKKLDGFKTTMCHNDNWSCNPVYNGTITVHLRDRCTDVAYVHNPVAPGVVWTDRMWKAGQFVATGYSFTHASTRTGASESLEPFGRIATIPATQNADALTYGSDPAGIAPDTFEKILPVFNTEGGSPFTYIYWNSAASAYKNDGGRSYSGVPYACVGACGGTGLPASWNNNGASALPNATRRLSELFATAEQIYHWGGNSNDLTYQPAGGWDDRSRLTSFSKRPRVVGVDTSIGKCIDGEEGVCQELATEGLTMISDRGNSTSAGTDIIQGADGGGRLTVKIRYYAYADKDQMPLRRKVFDFGDGKLVPSGDAYYKNHRGAFYNGPVAAANLKKICSSDYADWGKYWGLTDDTCDPRYFEEAKTYVCNTPYRDSLPACSNLVDEETYPCKEGNYCVFRPRVQFTDNWGVCNGTCVKTDGDNFCLNTDRNNDVEGNDCFGNLTTTTTKPSEKAPWTWAYGKIKIEVP
ncbi:MAG: hypothetical protein WCT10_04165 [Patescibacteria group bacterium]